jgi:hypothetical protein
MRSTVWFNTKFVSWSQERRVPVRVRPSEVRTRTFSKVVDKGQLRRQGFWRAGRQTIDIRLE